MGGRGTFASGNNVAYTYETVEKIEGVKVLQGLNGKHNLPEEAHFSEAYILVNGEGSFKRYRGYNKNLTSAFDIDYHPEPKITGNRERVYHIHFYKNGRRDPVGRELTAEEYNKYKKYFGGAKK